MYTTAAYAVTPEGAGLLLGYLQSFDDQIIVDQALIRASLPDRTGFKHFLRLWSLPMSKVGEKAHSVSSRDGLDARRK